LILNTSYGRTLRKLDRAPGYVFCGPLRNLIFPASFPAALGVLRVLFSFFWRKDASNSTVYTIPRPAMTKATPTGEFIATRDPRFAFAGAVVKFTSTFEARHIDFFNSH
jgi:hypothetical protein